MSLGMKWVGVATLLLCFCGSSFGQTLPQAGDVVFGLSTNNADTTLELIRGPVTPLPAGGVQQTDFWNGTTFIQSVEFDNFNGLPRNARGNLLGVNFGTTALGGSIFNFSTTNNTVTAGQVLWDDATGWMANPGLTKSRLNGLSVNPNNSRIAVTGSESRAVFVFDYTPGNTAGSGAALANPRQTINDTFLTGGSIGTTWLDNNTVLALSAAGELFEVNSTSMAFTNVATLPFFFTASPFTSLDYQPSISPYLYASASTFSGGVTTNKLFVLDPRVGYSVVKEVDLSTSVNTLREIGLGANGDLFIGQFGGSTAPGPFIDVLADVVTNPAALTDNSTFDWYKSPTQSNFNGLSVALNGGAPTIGPDFNNDGLINCADVNALTGVIAAGSNNPAFDLTGDAIVNGDDLTRWLSDAGNANIGPGRSYRFGDANLDGVVDGSDFGVWNSNKFTTNTDWCGGNFSADTVVDGSDFGIWNSNKFTSSDGAMVPEPTGLVALVFGLALWGLRRR